MSESNRALFAVCAIVDYVSLENIPYDTDNILKSSIYVGRSGFLVTVGYNDPDRSDSLFIVLDTRDITKASYFLVPFGGEAIQLVMENACSNGCYAVDIVDFTDQLDYISSIS